MRVCPECFSIYGPSSTECPKDAAKLVHYTDLLIGLNLGPYVVRSLISEGGMGIVFAAEHPTLGRRVAIKILRPELSLRDDIVERFIQEARAVNTIGHGNIVSVYDFGKTPFGTFYIVMEYLDGRTVRSLIDSVGPQPLERARWILQETGTALAAAHAKGFVHRDVKPANVMVCRRSGVEFVKLLDFGIVKLLSEVGQTADMGEAAGTAQYMSPEQLDGLSADHRTDVYALGAVAYELLTGQVPYPGNSQAAVRRAQVTRRPPPPSICRRDIQLSTTIDDVILRAIAIDPDQRFPSMEAFLNGFAQAYENTLARQSRPRARGKSRPRWALWALGVAAALAASTVGIWLLTARAPRRQAVATPQTPPPRRAQPTTAGAPRSAKAIAQLVGRTLDDALNAPDRGRRRRCLRQLRTARLEQTRDRLVGALRDEDSLVRRLAALTLGELGRRDPTTIQALRQALPHQVSFAAIAVAKALTQLGDPVGRRRLRRECALARRRGPRAIRFALEQLADVDPSAARGLAKYERMIEWSQSPESKAHLLAHLAALGRDKPRKRLERAMASGADVAIRAHAALVLADFDAEMVKPTLRRISRNGPSELRARAAGRLSRLGDAAAGLVLVELLSSHSSGARAISALEIARTRSEGTELPVAAKRVRSELAVALVDKNEDVRVAAALALLAL